MASDFTGTVEWASLPGPFQQCGGGLRRPGAWYQRTVVTRNQGHTPPWDPTVGLCLEAYDLPWGGACTQFRVTPVRGVAEAMVILGG